MAALAVVLAVTAQAYGYHRDELYFRMLEPARGYVDQPPLTPLIAHALAGVIDEPWFLRLPSVLAAVAAVKYSEARRKHDETNDGSARQNIIASGFDGNVSYGIPGIQLCSAGDNSC